MTLMQKKITVVTLCAVIALCAVWFYFFLTQYTGGELFSALRKLKIIVNLTIRLPVRKTSFLFSIDYRVTVGKAKGHRRFLFKQVKC